jgi:hypothetical protein
MGLRKAIQNYDPVQAYYVQTSAAGTAPDAFIFVNPTGSGEYYEIVQAVAIWDVVGGASAAADVKIVPTATALASGTTALASTFDLTTGARTAVNKALTTTAANRIVKPGDALAVDTSGTLTGLTGLVVQVYLRPMRGAKKL